MAKPRLGFIGTGMMGQLAHLANYAVLRDRGECEIAGATDLQQKLAHAVADKYHVETIYNTAEALLADSSINGVVCIQQWPNNYPLVKQILNAGKSVMTEKPMVGRLDEAEELTALARQKGLYYAVGFMKRYDTGVEIAKKLIDELRASSELGPLLSVDALCNGGDWLHNVEAPLRDDASSLPPLKPTFPDACQTQEQKDIYHYLVNIFSHNINLCHYLLGGEMETHFAQFRGNRGMNAALRLGDLLVTVRGATSAGYEWRELTTFTFLNGEVTIKTPTPMNRQSSAVVTLLQRRDGNFTTQTYHAPVEWAFFREAQGFVRTLEGSETLRAPAEMCVWDVRVMQRIIEIAEVV
jgi:predicted dehydrogenase